MELQPLPPLERIETAEPGPPSQAPAYKNAQVWKDLEKETGFASCADYMEFYKGVRPDFVKRLEEFRELPVVLEAPAPIAIYDLLKNENLPISIEFRSACDLGTVLIQALREPPANVCVQLVLLSYEYFTISQELADAFVLGLKLDPQLLDDVRQIARMGQHPRKGFRTSQINHVIGNDTITVLSRDYMPAGTEAVPVLLIASAYFKQGRERGTIGGILARSNYGKPPIPRSAPGEFMDYLVYRTGLLYARNVQQFIFRCRSATPSEAFALLAAMSPLLYIESYRVREASICVRDTYDAITRGNPLDWHHSGTDDTDPNKALYKQRLKLRRTLEEAEEYASQLFSYLGSQVALDWSTEPSYVSFQADFRSVTDEARRLETEVRDYMQLEVGNLSLEESRRSIELSNLQIRESKSVKIFTVLAFVYVPVNLATSIFGMNIQQLNNSGQNIWVFIVTTIVALLVTFTSWLCSKTIYNAAVWYKEQAKIAKRDGERERREFALPVRIAMLVWLICNGHSAWMWKSGAWHAILMNSNVRKDWNGNDQCTACEFVSINSQRPRHEQYPFDAPERNPNTYLFTLRG